MLYSMGDPAFLVSLRSESATEVVLAAMLAYTPDGLWRLPPTDLRRSFAVDSRSTSLLHLLRYEL